MKSFKEFLKQKMHNEEVDVQKTPDFNPSGKTNSAIVKSANGDFGSMKSYMPTMDNHENVMTVQNTLIKATGLKENDPRIKDVVSVIKNIPNKQLNRYHLTNIRTIKILYLGHEDSRTGYENHPRSEEHDNKLENWKTLEKSIPVKQLIYYYRSNT